MPVVPRLRTVTAAARFASFAAVSTSAPTARAAANALLDNTDLTAAEVVTEALKIAARICIYSNDEITVEELG